jgi:hypothetical protein
LIFRTFRVLVQNHIQFGAGHFAKEGPAARPDPCLRYALGLWQSGSHVVVATTRIQIDRQNGINSTDWESAPPRPRPPVRCPPPLQPAPARSRRSCCRGAAGHSDGLTRLGGSLVCDQLVTWLTCYADSRDLDYESRRIIQTDLIL